MTDPRIEAAVEAWVSFVEDASLEKIGKKLKINDSEILHGIREGMALALSAADAAAWIKISIHLPNDGQEVLVSTRDGIVINDGFHLDDEGGYFDCVDDRDVTHWQPLPKPPAPCK